jgi:hypothetical protein
MCPGRGQIHWQQWKALQDAFDKRGTLGSDLRLYRPLHSIEQFTRRDHGQKKLLVLSLCHVWFQFQPPPLYLDQDTSID